MCSAYQEYHRDIEEECNHGISDEQKDAHIVDVLHGHRGNLENQGSNGVHDGTDGCKVVQGHQRIHLELG